MSENEGVLLAIAGGGAVGAVIGSAMAVNAEAVWLCLIPLLGWLSTVVVQVIHAHLHAERTRDEIRLMKARRDLDDAIADVIAKVEADIAAGELEPVPIDVTHDAVGIDGSCIRVR